MKLLQAIMPDASAPARAALNSARAQRRKLREKIAALDESCRPYNAQIIDAQGERANIARLEAALTQNLVDVELQRPVTESADAIRDQLASANARLQKLDEKASVARSVLDVFATQRADFYAKFHAIDAQIKPLAYKRVREQIEAKAAAYLEARAKFLAVHDDIWTAVAAHDALAHELGRPDYELMRSTRRADLNLLPASEVFEPQPPAISSSTAERLEYAAHERARNEAAITRNRALLASADKLINELLNGE